MCHVNPMPSGGFTINIKIYFFWESNGKYSRLSSAAVVIDALRVKNNS